MRTIQMKLNQKLMNMNRISKHISYVEATRSQTATRRRIDNTPSFEQLSRMKTLAKKVFEPVREYVGKPIRVSSFFRSVKLNKRIGGSASSQHCKGEAMDIQGMMGVTNAEIFHYIKDNLVFDQLIWEFGNSKEPAWVHVSYTTRRNNRKQVIVAYKNKFGRTKYKVWK